MTHTMASAMHTIRINLIRRGRLKAPLVRKKNWRASNVAQLNSRVVSIVEKPPRMTTVAHVNTRVPRPLPALSMNAMMRTKRFRCFSGGSGGALHRRMKDATLETRKTVVGSRPPATRSFHRRWGGRRGYWLRHLVNLLITLGHSATCKMQTFCVLKCI
uniref:Uncharacterized protein n=1 Tax=Oryza nivara TaxID=4536 RepID=A0A0E0I4Z9_ORYNI